MPKTAEFIEATQAAKESPGNTPKNRAKGKRGNAARIAPWQWKPGQSGNPNGRPKNDMARLICQAVFENNPELVYKGLVRQLKRGSGFTFQVASERAYGKLKETKEITHVHESMSDKELDGQIAAILKRLGLAGQIDSIGAPEGEGAPTVAA